MSRRRGTRAVEEVIRAPVEIDLELVKLVLNALVVLERVLEQPAELGERVDRRAHRVGVDGVGEPRGPLRVEPADPRV